MTDTVWILEIVPTYSKTTYLYFRDRDSAVRYAMRLIRAMGKTASQYSIGLFEDSLENYFSQDFGFKHYEILKA